MCRAVTLRIAKKKKDEAVKRKASDLTLEFE